MRHLSAPDVTIIVVAHDEGLASYKSWLSLAEARASLESLGISSSISVVCYRCDEVTLRGLSVFSKNGTDVFQFDASSLGGALNTIVERDASEYLAFVRASDLITSNWICEAIRLDKEVGGNSIWHPEALVEFGTDVWKHLIWLQPSCGATAQDRLIALRRNPWPGPIIAKRSIFGSIRFADDISAFGYEQSCLVADSLARGIIHRSVPKSASFHRILKESDYFYHYPGTSLCPANELMDYWSQVGHVPSEMNLALVSRPEQGSCHSGRKSTGRSLVSRAGMRIKRALFAYVSRDSVVDGEDISESDEGACTLPEWLIETWRVMNGFDNHLWPTRGAMRTAEILTHETTERDLAFAGAFHKVALASEGKLDMLFLTYDPLSAGGTEKVLARYATTLQELHPSWNQGVMRSKPEFFPYKVPSQFAFIDFFGSAEGFDEHDRFLLMDRLVAYYRPARLFGFFAGWALGDFSYNWVRARMDFILKKNIRVYAALFMNEAVNSEDRGRILNLADPFLREIEPILTRVFTDNDSIRLQALRLNPFSSSLIKVHYQPVEGAFRHVRIPDPERPLRVLWASRLASQKRPDIVRDIGLALDSQDEEMINIAVYGREQNVSSNIFAEVESVDYFGAFAGFDSIPLDSYDVFLYTSDTDGLPNVLLEAIQAGFPVVASDAGGIGEVIVSESTGFLVDIENVGGYVDALKDIHKHPEKAWRFATNAQRLLVSCHTFEDFIGSVKNDIS